MRAGPLSDEAVIRLLNRRFVSFHFDLFGGAYLGDAEAKKWVSKHLPEFAGNMVATPPIVFVTPEGEIVGKVSNYAATEGMLSKMHEILNANPEFNRLSDAEKKLTGIEKAQMLIDFQQYEQAAKLLSGESSDAARYLLGHLARLNKDWDTLEQQFAKITNPKLRDDMRMERAYLQWGAKDYSGLAKALMDFPSDSSRFSEARYFEGLAFYHQGKIDEAKKIWRDLIKSSKEDRWVYRADWAYAEAGQKSQRSYFSTAGGGRSLLGRIGYMGAQHPDLQGKD